VVILSQRQERGCLNVGVNRRQGRNPVFLTEMSRSCLSAFYRRFMNRCRLPADIALELGNAIGTGEAETEGNRDAEGNTDAISSETRPRLVCQSI
jgi:hypothetical protein